MRTGKGRFKIPLPKHSRKTQLCSKLILHRHWCPKQDSIHSSISSSREASNRCLSSQCLRLAAEPETKGRVIHRISSAMSNITILREITRKLALLNERASEPTHMERRTQASRRIPQAAKHSPLPMTTSWIKPRHRQPTTIRETPSRMC